MGALRRVALAGAVVVLGLASAQVAQADVVAERTFDEGTLADGYDYDYRWNGSGWTRITRTGVGMLSTAMTGASGPNPSGLTLLKTICIALEDSRSKGRHCWKKYKPTNADSNPNYNYRLYWVKGSSTSKSGHRLTRIRDQVLAMTTGMHTVDWSPDGTVNVGSCITFTGSLSAAFYGISVGVSASFLICPEVFGPDYLGARQFRFKWAGSRGAGNYIGMGGGALYAVPAGANASARFWLEHVTCNTDSSGC